MSIETRATKAGEDLRRATTVDAEGGLLSLETTARRRRARDRWLVAVALAVLVVSGWALNGVVRSTSQSAPPATSPTSGPPPTCPLRVTCLGNQAYRFELAVPVVWRIPPPFGVASGGGPTRDLVESYWIHQGNTAGVSILEGVRAAQLGTIAVDRRVADNARAFTLWLAARPFVVASPVTTTYVDGRRAWTVRVRLAPNAGQGPSECNGQPCFPVTARPSDIGPTGIWSDMVADYTAFNLPGGGTTVIWSWAFGDDTAALTRSRALVRGISFD